MDAAKLSKEQKYLMHILPKLNRRQVQMMMQTVEYMRKGEEEQKADDPYRELMEMTGCRSAKEQLTAMITAYGMNKIVSGRKHIDSRQYYHAVFRGNAGCAKTTCARLYAGALARAGVTRKDSFAELSRAMICGRYVGETAPKVRELFEKNAGGVIFVDEAYALTEGEGNENSFGLEAVNEFVIGLENHPDTVVIFAGYPEPMDRFLKANPGLNSRIPYSVDFEDYTEEELMEISLKMAAKNGFSVSDEGRVKMMEIIRAARLTENFGNGRFCRNLIDNAIRCKGLNLGVAGAASLEPFMDPEQYSDEKLFILEADCFDAESRTAHAQKRRIGF